MVEQRERLPTRSRVAVTLGDPAGIGPEVVVKALSLDPDLLEICRPIVVGPMAVLAAARDRFAPSMALSAFGSLANAGAGTGVSIEVLDIPLPAGWVAPAAGVATSGGGLASVLAIEEAARRALAGDVDAIATAPINKEAVHLAGYQDIGHQEVLARMSGVTEIATMLMAGRLRAVHLTTHVPFRDAAAFVTKDRVLARLRLIDRSFRAWGVSRPRIGVAALNPHGGDAGLLGVEEIEALSPAVAEARRLDIDATGPIPADSVYLRAAAGEFDAILALYHDQGHIAVKMLDFHGSVSVNLGLPFVRTSVDHGTAYDIAGKGVAQHRSMAEAIRLAARLAQGQGFATT
ncbi:MAG: 4-hydroxythreonine-4-phosphate dehydrogenase PdxA [Chloroflexi bacterium]|nr:4-hydroxythreonine-4-phosphate dehydrogenase PdxA [Chloroflexota bacterium]